MATVYRLYGQLLTSMPSNIWLSITSIVTIPNEQHPSMKLGQESRPDRSTGISERVCPLQSGLLLRDSYAVGESFRDFAAGVNARS